MRQDALFALVRDKPAYREGSKSRINIKKFGSEHCKMSFRPFKAFMLFGILLASAFAYPTYGQSEVILSLDKRVYTVGESVAIVGLVQSPSTIPVIVQVWNPNNEACSFQHADVKDDGSFTASQILLSGKICGIAGKYTIKVFYGEFEGSATFEVQLPTASVKKGNGRLQILVEILSKAKENVDNKIADVQSKGITIPDDINAIYEEGLAEFESTKQAVTADDFDSAKKHAKNAMKAFRKVLAKSMELEQEEPEAEDASSKVAQKDLEKAEEISRLKQAIARTIEFKNKLTKIAATSAAASTIEASIADFDKAISEAKEFAENGDVDAAAKSLARAKQILADIHKSLVQNVQKQKIDKSKEFVKKTVERIDRMIADAKAMGLPQEVIDALEAAKQKILNAKTVNEITEISKDLKGKQEELSEHKGKNFGKAVEHLKLKLEETKAKAEQIGLNLNVFDRMQDLIDDAIAKWESGETKNAVDTLEKSAEILREVNSILDHVSDKLRELDRLEESVEKLKEKYQDNPEALNAIEKALRLISGARETLKSAMSEKDFKIAEDMVLQAKHILQRIKESEHEEERMKEKEREQEKEVKTGVGDASKFEKFIGELEHRADNLQRMAKEQGKSEALAVIQQAMQLITKAKQMVSEEKYDRATALLREANDLLNKAERMLKEGSDVGTAPVKEMQADVLMKEIQMLEAVAADLKSKAGDNEDALDEIEEALDDIKDAKEAVSEGKLDKAKKKVSDAKEHLRKAQQIIEHGEEAKGEKEREKEKEKEKDRESEKQREKEKEKNRSG